MKIRPEKNSEIYSCKCLVCRNLEFPSCNACVIAGPIRCIWIDMLYFWVKWETGWLKKWLMCWNLGLGEGRGVYKFWDLARSLCCVLWQNTLLSQSLNHSTHECKLVLENCQGNMMKCWGVTLQWIGIPSRGE